MPRYQEAIFRKLDRMRKPLLIATTIVTLAAATLPAQAISRYQSTGMSCAAIQDVISKQTAAIMRYPSKRVPGLVLYDRYVKNGNYCDSGEVTETVTIPSRDGQCPVYHCIEAPDPCDMPFAGARCND